MSNLEQINFRADAEVRAALDELCVAYAAQLQPGMRRDGIKSQMIRRAILELAATSEPSVWLEAPDEFRKARELARRKKAA
mgnify:CR=1 FL=1